MDHRDSSRVWSAALGRFFSSPQRWCSRSPRWPTRGDPSLGGHTHHRLTSPLHPSRHVDSVGCDQLRIRHLCTELEQLEPSLSFWLGEKRQQVLASQPVV